MFKSIQTKIILILIIISLIMIIGTGFFYISTLEKTKQTVQEQELIEKNIETTKKIIIISSASFTVIRYYDSHFFFKNDISTNC